VEEGMRFTARAYTRLKFLALSAAGTAAAALAACGGTTSSPTDTPAATKPAAAAATTGPLPTPPNVPQSLGVTDPAGSATTGQAGAATAYLTTLRPGFTASGSVLALC